MLIKDHGNSPRWKLVYFLKNEKGKLIRKEKLVWDPKSEGVKKVLHVFEVRGIKAHLVCRRLPQFPPKGEREDEDQLWCCYCRRWRFFAVPKKKCVQRTIGLRLCKWCGISEEEFYIVKYNNLWNRAPRKRKSKGRKKRKQRR